MKEERKEREEELNEGQNSMMQEGREWDEEEEERKDNVRK